MDEVFGTHKSVSIGIEPLTVLAGTLPPRVLGQVFEWAALHQGELLTDWELVTAHQLPVPIPPLASNTTMITPLCDVTDVEILGHHRLRLTFSDGLASDAAHAPALDGHAPAAIGHGSGCHRLVARVFQPGRHASVPRSRVPLQNSTQRL